MSIKLDEDGHSIDGFSRQRMPGWSSKHNWWDSEPSTLFSNAMYAKYSKKIISFLSKHVSCDIDYVFSKYCRMISSEKSRNKIWLRNAWNERFISFNVRKVDGILYESQARRGVYNRLWLWRGPHFYVMENCKILCNKEKDKVWNESKDSDTVVSGDFTFKRLDVGYKRKIACGKFVDVPEYCWFKLFSVRFSDSHVVLNTTLHPDGTREYSTSFEHYIRVEERKVTASKKELINHSLRRE